MSNNQWPPPQGNYSNSNPDATRSMGSDANYSPFANPNSGQPLGYDPTWQQGYGDGYGSFGQANQSSYGPNVYQGELPPQGGYPRYPNYPPTQGYANPYQQRQWGRGNGLTSFMLILSFISIIVMAVVGIFLATFTGVWWLAILFPAIGVLRLFAPRTRRGGYASSGFVASRLISLLITIAIFGGIFYAIMCGLGRFKF